MWPYCKRRCSYCNFNKYISRNVDHLRMERCLATETRTLLDISGIKRITSVFFGGGTPSLAHPRTFHHILDTLSKTVHLPGDAEITMEANPTAFGQSHKLSEFKAAGINRLSIGVQALNNRDLDLLGRDHTVEDALKCIELGTSLFPGRVSIDLIFGRPYQTLSDWNDELSKALPLFNDHVSLYQLTLERGTHLFKQVQTGELCLPDEEVQADMYRSAVEILEANGIRRYEVSNFSKTGAESVHNQSYWQGRQYIGVGPGAHGRFSVGEDRRQSRIQTLEPDNWMYEVDRYGHATRKVVPLGQLEILEELLMTGLRMITGISQQQWLTVGGRPLMDIFAHDDRYEELVDRGYLKLDSEALWATSEGLIMLDSILPDLINILQDSFKKLESMA